MANKAFKRSVDSVPALDGDLDPSFDPDSARFFSHPGASVSVKPARNSSGGQAIEDPWLPKDLPEAMLSALKLGNAPNPCNPRTEIRYWLPQSSAVRLGVYDLRGRELRVLTAGEDDAGWHEVVWDGCDAAGGVLPSGVYLAQLATETRVEGCRMTLVR